MTLDELIKTIDIYLPGNRFDNAMKTKWLNEVEGKIFDELETLDFKPEGNVIRYVRRDNAGNWVYEDGNENKTPAAVSAEDMESTDDPDYVKEIDPLNMECCVSCRYLKDDARYELQPYSYEDDKETKLIVPDRFADVYIHYILAKMHQADGEIDNYNNEVGLYQASYTDYGAWRIRHYRDNEGRRCSAYHI